MRESSNSAEILVAKEHYPELDGVYQRMRGLLSSIKKCTSLSQIDLFAKDINTLNKNLAKLKSQSSDRIRESIVSDILQKSILLQKFYDTTVNNLCQTRFSIW